MRVWWRKEPLTSQEMHMISVLWDAHTESCFRNNASTIVIASVADSSQDMAKALAAGILTLGGKHAPIEQTVEFLLKEDPWRQVDHLVYLEKRIPGWGGTFQKDQEDPLWGNVKKTLEKYYPELAEKIAAVTVELHNRGKKIHPNPSAYTAAVAIAIGMNPKSAVSLVIACRLDAWCKIAAEYMEVKSWATEPSSAV
jgi:citrate synthase